MLPSSRRPVGPFVPSLPYPCQHPTVQTGPSSTGSVHRPVVATRAANELSTLERLKAENESLRSSLKDVESGAAIALDLIDAEGVMPEDFWSPAVHVPDGHEFVEEYGAPSQIPNHDGTECFKWDNTMWSAADHFKVCLGFAFEFERS